MLLEYRLRRGKRVIKKCPENDILKFVLSPLTGEIFYEPSPKGLFRIALKKKGAILEEYGKE